MLSSNDEDIRLQNEPCHALRRNVPALPASRYGRAPISCEHSALLLGNLLVICPRLARLINRANLCHRHIPPGPQRGHSLFRIDEDDYHGDASSMLCLLQVPK
jgi:hypothetical protein